ncbi:Aspartate/methionine/tyrosine aminotransferase [Loktanella fryxellensis]|uniref:aspartate transaminase n=1 Tax=Loktanella fryxellensis TaxID=245187 RepID=A0A1H7YMU0_9RHOB|nr:aminotransferase [Loktanella fryxellensis]SEM46489.1 Aspartate/methionine/tyrosine aminotransferase [Loktanella fryxellensis]
MTIPRTTATIAPPVMQARRWLDGVVHPADRPLLNVSQAAPTAPPPLALRQAIARSAMEDDAAHLYGPVLGLPALRAAVADRWTRLYGGAVAAGQVAITSGCNQAFAAAIASLCGEGDAVILAVPWYFNHAMWLDMAGVAAIPLQTGPDLLPDPDAAAALITARTRAIVLVTPNNPCGVAYPAATLRAFRDLCRAHRIALIVDETYRDFDARVGAPHDLFADASWDDTLIQLYSFSKAYRLTGHRVGTIATSPARLAEIEKFLDTVTICPNQLGQRAALWGMENLDDWLQGERSEIIARAAAIATHAAPLTAQGWQVLGCGAYFAYLRHPHPVASVELAERLVAEAGILCLPGTMFRPADDPAGARELRIAFANIDTGQIAELFDRLARWQP